MHFLILVLFLGYQKLEQPNPEKVSLVNVNLEILDILGVNDKVNNWFHYNFTRDLTDWKHQTPLTSNAFYKSNANQKYPRQFFS